MTASIKTYPLSVLDGMDGDPGDEHPAGPAILARAAAHNAITGEELPAVLDAIGEARSGSTDDHDPPPLTPEKARELADEGAQASAAYLRRTRGMVGASSERDALAAEVERLTRERDEDMQRMGVLLESRNAYRDRLRKMLNVTEQLLALVERTGHADDKNAHDETEERKAIERSDIEIADHERQKEVQRAEAERLVRQNRLLHARLATAERQAKASADAVQAIESDLGIKITDPEEPLADRLLRVRSVLLHGDRGARAKERTLKRWQARARKAEARVAVLTEERDGLTLRLGEKERARMQASSTGSGAKSRPASTVTPPAAPAPLKRGDRVRLSARGHARSAALRRHPRGVVMGPAPDGSGDVLVLRDGCKLSMATPADLWEQDDAKPARKRKGGR